MEKSAGVRRATVYREDMTAAARRAAGIHVCRLAPHGTLCDTMPSRHCRLLVAASNYDLDRGRRVYVWRQADRRCAPCNGSQCHRVGICRLSHNLANHCLCTCLPNVRGSPAEAPCSLPCDPLKRCPASWQVQPLVRQTHRDWLTAVMSAATQVASVFFT